MNIRFTTILASLGLFLLSCEASALLCRVGIVEGMSEESLMHPQDSDDDDQAFTCDLDNHTISYSLDLPQEFVSNYTHIGNGHWRVLIDGAQPVFDRESMKPPFISIPSNATISIVSSPSDATTASHHRHLQSPASKTIGNKTILVLRISSPDTGAVELSKETLSERIFGIGPNAPARTVSGQYSDCSYDQLNFFPAQGNGVVNGVAEIALTTNIFNVDPQFLEVIIAEQAEAALGINGTLDENFDHIMFVFPHGTAWRKSQKWAAFAYIGKQRSLFNNLNAGYLTVVMHELAHNFGFQHSSENRSPYGDKSGIMGYAYQAVGTPYKCFNGHKNYMLGWFADKTITVNITEGSWGGNIAGLTSYDVIRPEDYMLVNVGDLYLQFNRANKFNQFSKDFKNQVTIVRGTAPDQRSNLLGAVSQINEYLFATEHRVENFQGTGSDLVIEACEQQYLAKISPDLPDFVRVSIYLDNGEQSSECNRLQVAPPPSEGPSSSPSSTPTMGPTSLPSASPSFAPTPMDCTGMDQPGLVPVSHQLGNRTCEWIASHNTWKTYLCQEGFEAFEQCQETCNSCNLQVTEMPSDACEDSRKMVYVNEHLGHIRCIWVRRFLRLNPSWKDRVCAIGQEAHSECRETCGTCTDTCEDQADATFYVNRKQGFQNCAWLATRPLWQAKMCKEGLAPYNYCNEICNTCP